MSEMSEMSMLVVEAIELIKAGNSIAESLDAVVLTNDLTPGETRSIIYFLAQKGYRFHARG
jgi:hypothetical protein